MSARLGGRVITLFPQPGGGRLGLMPVPVLEPPGEYAVEFLDQAQRVVQSARLTVVAAHYGRQNVVLAETAATLKATDEETELTAAFRKEVSPERFWTEPLQKPVPGCLTSRFGVQRYVNGKPTGDFHAGFDQRGATGTPVHAITGGKVKIARMFTLRGGTVAIDHGQGLQSIYMHLSKLDAKEGDRVAPGGVIGYVGATGRANAPHLHWTLYANGVPVNPAQWVSVPSCYAAPPPRKARK